MIPTNWTVRTTRQREPECVEWMQRMFLFQYAVYLSHVTTQKWHSVTMARTLNLMYYVLVYSRNGSDVHATIRLSFLSSLLRTDSWLGTCLSFFCESTTFVDILEDVMQWWQTPKPWHHLTSCAGCSLLLSSPSIMITLVWSEPMIVNSVSNMLDSHNCYASLESFFLYDDQMQR